MNDPCDDKIAAAYIAGVVEGASSQPATSSDDVKAQIDLLEKTKAETDKKIQKLADAEIAEEKQAQENRRAAKALQAETVKAQTAKGEAQTAKGEAKAEKEKADQALSKAETAKEQAAAAILALQQEEAELKVLQANTESEAVTTLKTEKQEALNEIDKAKKDAQQLAEKNAATNKALAKAKQDAEAELTKYQAAETVKAEAAKLEAQTAQKQAGVAREQAETAKAVLENERAEIIALRDKTESNAVVRLEGEKQQVVAELAKANSELVAAQAATAKVVAAKALADAKLENVIQETKVKVATSEAAKKIAEDEVAEKAAANEALVNEKAEAEANLAVAQEAVTQANEALTKAKEAQTEAAAQSAQALTKANEAKTEAAAQSAQALVAAQEAAAQSAQALVAANKKSEDAQAAAETERNDLIANLNGFAGKFGMSIKKNVSREEILKELEKFENAALQRIKTAEAKAQADLDAKIKEAQDKIADLLNKLQITEKAAKKAKTELILAKIAGSKAEAELKSARDILISSKDIFLDDSSTSESELKYLYHNDSGDSSSDDSGDELSILRRNVQEKPPIKEPSIKELLGKWIKEGKRSRGTIIEQRELIEKQEQQKRELKKEEDSLVRLMQQQDTATKKIDATKQATEGLRAINKNLSEKIKRIEKARNVWKTKEGKKREELKALKNDYHTMQAKFIQMKNANTNLMTEKKELNIVAQGVVNDKDQQIAELKDRLDTIENTEAEEIVDLNQEKSNYEKDISKIKKIVGINDTKQLIRDLTNVRRIIDKANEANKKGAELTFETLPKYIKNYRLYQINQARLMEESKNDTGKTIQELDKRLTRATASFTDILMSKEKRNNLIPVKMKMDLIKTFTTADTLPTPNTLNQSSFDTKVGLTKQELILEYYSANYDKFIEHLTLVCAQDYSKYSITMTNNCRKFLNSMISFGELLHEKIELLMKVKTHFTEARDTLRKLTQISEINSKITDLQANDGENPEISKLQTQRKNMIKKLPTETGIPVLTPDKSPAVPQIPSYQKSKPFVRVRF